MIGHLAVSFATASAGLFRHVSRCVSGPSSPTVCWIDPSARGCSEDSTSGNYIRGLNVREHQPFRAHAGEHRPSRLQRDFDEDRARRSAGRLPTEAGAIIGALAPRHRRIRRPSFPSGIFAGCSACSILQRPSCRDPASEPHDGPHSALRAFLEASQRLTDGAAGRFSISPTLCRSAVLRSTGRP